MALDTSGIGEFLMEKLRIISQESLSMLLPATGA
jgi:hypothetical protein